MQSLLPLLYPAVSVLPNVPWNFNVDNIRVAKIMVSDGEWWCLEQLLSSNHNMSPLLYRGFRVSSPTPQLLDIHLSKVCKLIACNA